MGGLNVTDVRRKRIPLLWNRAWERMLAKGFSLPKRKKKLDHQSWLKLATYPEVLLHLILQKAWVVRQLFTELLNQLVELDHLNRVSVMIPVRWQALWSNITQSVVNNVLKWTLRAVLDLEFQRQKHIHKVKTDHFSLRQEKTICKFQRTNIAIFQVFCCKALALSVCESCGQFAVTSQTLSLSMTDWKHSLMLQHISQNTHALARQWRRWWEGSKHHPNHPLSQNTHALARQWRRWWEGSKHHPNHPLSQNTHALARPVSYTHLTLPTTAEV